MKTKYKFLIVIIVSIFIICLGYNYAQKNMGQKIDSPQKLINKLNNQNKKQLSYEIYYQPGCKDCDKVIDEGLWKITKKEYKENNNVYIINTQTFKKQNPNLAKYWFNKNMINSTPTIIVRYKDFSIYNYTGTDIQVIKNLFENKNPITKKTLTTKNNPIFMEYQNDFTHKHERITTNTPKY